MELVACTFSFVNMNKKEINIIALYSFVLKISVESFFTFWKGKRVKLVAVVHGNSIIYKKKIGVGFSLNSSW